MPIGTRSEIKALLARKRELCELHNFRGNNILGPSHDWWFAEAGIIDPTITAERKALQASIKAAVADLDDRISHLTKYTPGEAVRRIILLVVTAAMVTMLPYALLWPFGVEALAVVIGVIYTIPCVANISDRTCWRGR